MADDEVTYVITPTLFLGDRPIRTFANTVCDNAADALEVIHAGGSVRLPEGAWPVAREILLALGLDEAHVQDRFHFARTGQILSHS